MQDDIDLWKIFGALWRRKLWILASAILFFCMSAWYAFTVPVPYYTASATVVLEANEQNLIDIESVVPGLSNDQSTVDTELEVFRSRILVERLVNDLGLTEDPEFNGQLRPPPKFSKDIAINYVKELITGPQPPKAPPADRVILDNVINAVLRSYSVNTIQKSLVFRITVVTNGAQKSAAIANSLAELYVDEQIRVKMEKTERATVWLSERVVDLKLELEDAENEQKEFSSNTDLVSPEGLVALNRNLKDLRERGASINEVLADQQNTLQQLRNALSARDYQSFATIAGDRAFAAALNAQGSVPVGDQNAVLDAQAQIVLQANQVEITRSVAQLEAINASIDSVTFRIDRQSSELVKLQQLIRETEATRVLYEAFLTRLKETSIQQGIQEADSRLLSRAVVPQEPSGPSRIRLVAVAVMLGVMTASGIVLLQEFTQSAFRSAEELEAATRISVLGQIPVIPARQRANVIKYLFDKPNSGAAEAIRNLRTSLLLANVDKDPKIIMSTSSIPGEGKTTQSISLALNFAKLDQKVLLIEGDIRRRVFADYFNLKDKGSFLQVLAGAAKLEDVLHTDTTYNFDILLGEKSSVNAADLFSTQKFAAFLETLAEKYDRVIIDTPPVLAVPDARVIGQNVDALIYSVKWNSTPKRAVAEGLKSLSSVNLRPSGLVLSQVNRRGAEKYGYGTNYGSYSGYYDD